MMFFPGIKGDPGPAGADSVVPGPVGPAGPAGQLGIFTGTYAAGATYYDSTVRKDIVAYAGNFWITNNPNKSGATGWGVPNVSEDWVPFGVPIPIVATKLELLYDAFINIGMDLSLPGFFKSNNFKASDGDFTGWVLNGGTGGPGGTGGGFTAYDATINGKVSTNTPLFNIERPNATMPSVGYNELEIPQQDDVDIPVNPLILNVPDNDTQMVFFGWMEDANSFVENRFGNSSQKFLINLEGIGQNDSSPGNDLFYIQVYYRTRDNGGAWDLTWTPVGQDWYMQKLAGTGQSFQLTRMLKITLTGTQDIQFSAGFSKGSGVGAAATMLGAKLSVEAFN